MRRALVGVLGTLSLLPVGLISNDALATDLWGDEVIEGESAAESSIESGNESVDGTSESPLAVELGEFLLTPALQYRLRFLHHEGQDFTNGAVADTLRHRARIGLAANWAERLGAVVHLQDVRTFGEELDSHGDFSADGFDVHEAYAYVAPFANFRIFLGRQQIALENERLIGAVDWSLAARSFDALRFAYEYEDLTIESFYSKVREDNVGLGIPGDDFAQRHLVAANIHYDMAAEFASGLVTTADIDRSDGKRLHTIGAVFSGELASSLFSYEAEGYYQFGSAYDEINYSSFLFAVDAKVTIDIPSKPYLEAYGAFLSGDAEPADRTRKTFEVPYGNYHRYYGEMDMFVDLPSDTGLRGLRDIGGAMGASPTKGLSARVAYHFFQAMAVQPDGLDTFGHELDVKVDYRFWQYARMALAYGIFFPGDITKAGVSDPQAEHFAYATAEVKF